MGKLKGRIWPEDITINIGKAGKVWATGPRSLRRTCESGR
jgi:hypothetical protein